MPLVFVGSLKGKRKLDENGCQFALICKRVKVGFRFGAIVFCESNSFGEHRLRRTGTGACVNVRYSLAGKTKFGFTPATTHTIRVRLLGDTDYALGEQNR